MFKVTDEKTVEYYFGIGDEGNELVEVSGSKDAMETHLIAHEFGRTTAKDSATNLRKLADAILKIASKLEAIK